MIMANYWAWNMLQGNETENGISAESFIMSVPESDIIFKYPWSLWLTQVCGGGHWCGAEHEGGDPQWPRAVWCARSAKVAIWRVEQRRDPGQQHGGRGRGGVSRYTKWRRIKSNASHNTVRLHSFVNVFVNSDWLACLSYNNKSPS